MNHPVIDVQRLDIINIIRCMPLIQYIWFMVTQYHQAVIAETILIVFSDPPQTTTIVFADFTRVIVAT